MVDACSRWSFEGDEEDIQDWVTWYEWEPRIVEMGDSTGEVRPAAAAAAEGDAQVARLKERGTALLKQGDLTGAVSAYSDAAVRATSVDDVSSVHSNLALVLLKLHRPTEALAAADACIAAKPKWHKGHYRRGEALFELRRHADALAAYGAALELLPSDAD
eukprot:464628-Prymnesium_polylepis.1